MLATELSVGTERGGCPRVQVRTLRPSGTACLRSCRGRRAGSGEGQPGDRTFWAGLWAVGGGRAGRGRPCRSVSQATKALAIRTSAQWGSVSARSLGDPVCPAGVPCWVGARMARALAGHCGASKTQGYCCHCGEGDGRHQSLYNHTARPAAQEAAWALHS